MTAHNWFVDDEFNNARYAFRPVLEWIDAFDLDSPDALEGTWSLVDIRVTEAAEFDFSGSVVRVWSEPEAHRFNERAWRLLKAQPALITRIEAVGKPVERTANIATNQPAQHSETLARMRQLRQEQETDQAAQDRRQTG